MRLWEKVFTGMDFWYERRTQFRPFFAAGSRVKASFAFDEAERR